MSRNYGFCFALAAAVIIAVLILGSRALQVSAMESEPAPVKHYVSYEVQPGDSLWALAEKNCTDSQTSVTDYIAEVKKLNHLTSDRIISGSKLFLICYE